jgi:hypothetical protein
MSRCLLVMTLILSSLLSSCAAWKYEPYGYREGWRRAQVLEIGRAKTAMQYAIKDCRAELGGDSHYVRYAVTSYGYGSSSKLRINRVVAVPNDLPLEVGEWIYINISDCKKPLKRVDSRGTLS